jgi:uncharacterized protein YkwD
VFSALRPLLVLLTATVLGASLGLVPAQAAPSPDERYAGVAFKATNERRADRDLRRLRETACLDRMAERWARHMARTGRMVHQDLGPVLDRCGLSMVGENIARGYPTGRAVVRGWMGSPPHRANILRPQYRLMGIGAARGHGQWWSSQLFGRR